MKKRILATITAVVVSVALFISTLINGDTTTQAAPETASVTLAPPITTTTTSTTTTTTTAPTTTTRKPSQAASRGAARTPAPSGGILDRIAKCESGGSYTAKNRHSTASGKYQVLDSTWGHYGGYRRAMDAPPSVQEAHARELYALRGSQPWNASRGCWG